MENFNTNLLLGAATAKAKTLSLPFNRKNISFYFYFLFILTCSLSLVWSLVALRWSKEGASMAMYEERRSPEIDYNVDDDDDDDDVNSGMRRHMIDIAS